jgi:hypothetical protein
MVLWCQAGFSPDAYWMQTPRTLALALDGYRAECRRQSDLVIAGAWYGEVFQRAKKLKPLKDYLEKGGPQRKQGPREMLAILRGMPGATIRKVG